MPEFVNGYVLNIILQLIAGMIVSVVDPQPGDRIIDCCAAPGGKTLYIASQLSGQGILHCKKIHIGQLKWLLLYMNLSCCLNEDLCNAYSFFFSAVKAEMKINVFFSFLIDSSIRWFVWGLQSFLQLNTEYRVFPFWLLRWTFFLGWREGHTWELNWKTQTQNLFHTSDCLNWVKLLGEVLQILNLHFGLWNIPFKDGR